ncbi:MAG: hypothetical protein LBG65_03885 [Puniceicoccales bacterium]|jgi:hypothetical protein|nr:hypothetical protein [Puniceicoccales bacterium]
MTPPNPPPSLPETPADPAGAPGFAVDPQNGASYAQFSNAAGGSAYAQGEFPASHGGVVPELACDPAMDPALLAENLSPFKRFWRKYGGDSFLISVGVHIVLAIIAVTWVVSVVVINDKKDNKIDTGAGGGNNGDRVTMSEHRVKPKNARNMARSSMKLMSKSSTSSVSLPEMPSLSMASLDSGAIAGASSAGFGTGAGGGDGPGIGPGKGGGRNMVSFFGVDGFGAAGIVGTLYDIKRTPKGEPTAAAGSVPNYLAVARKFVNSGWNEAVLRGNYWESPTKLSLQQVLVPLMSAEAAPKSFKADGMAGKRWIAHYKGSVVAPFSGKMRFVGMADDWITVRWGKKNLLVAGYPASHTGSYVSGTPRKGAKPPAMPDGVGDSFPYGFRRPNFQTGPWFNVSKGSTYEIEIAIGETPGGEFCATLAFQMGVRDAKLLLFRMSNDPLPEGVEKAAIPANVDLTGGGFVWKPVMKNSRPLR